MQGYAATIYENGAVYSRFEGARKEGDDQGQMGGLQGHRQAAAAQGSGTFTVKTTGKPNEFMLEMEGEYVL